MCTSRARIIYYFIERRAYLVYKGKEKGAYSKEIAKSPNSLVAFDESTQIV